MDAPRSKRLELAGYHVDLRRPVQPTSEQPSKTRDFVFPILESSDGRKYLLVTDAGGSYGLPYQPLARLDASALTASGGKRVRGYVALDEFRRSLPPSTRVPSAPPADLLAHAATASAATAPPSLPEHSDPAFALSQLQTQLLSGAAAHLLTDGTLFGQLGIGPAALSLLSSAIGERVAGLLQGSQKLDDNSSSGQYLASIAAQQAVSRVKEALLSSLTGVGAGKSLAQKLDEFFCGETSNAQLEAGRDTDADDASGIVMAANEANVFAEHKPLATAYSADVVVAPGAPIVNGSLTVLAKGKPVARRTSETAAPSALATGASTVLVGGPGFSPAVVAIAQRDLAGSMPSSDQCSNELDRMRVAQNAYDQALAQGQGAGAAAAIAADAAHTPPPSSKQSMLLANVIYAEKGKSPDEGDFRGLVLVSDDGKHRVFSLDDHGPQCAETYDPRVGDTIFVDGDGLVLQRINDSSNGAPAGYKSMWFVDPKTGKSVLVFEGTNDSPDWYDNIVQGLGGVTPQYQYAAQDAAQFQVLHPGGQLVGHSLGGGLASFAGFMTGLPTTGYNSAGLGPGSVSTIEQHGVPAYLTNVTQIQISGEILTGLAELIGEPGTSGHIIEISPAGDDTGPLGLHYMQEVVMALSGDRILVLESGGHYKSLPSTAAKK